MEGSLPEAEKVSNQAGGSKPEDEPQADKKCMIGKINEAIQENKEQENTKNTVLREKALKIIRNLISDPDDMDDLEDEEKTEKGDESKTEEEKKAAMEKAKKMKELFITIKCMYVAKHLKEDNIPNEVIPRLYIGSIGSALSINVLKSRGVTHILSVAEKIKSAFPSDFIYKKTNVQDSMKEKISIYFEECTDFIHKALQENEKNAVLVHCFAGKSRSSTMIIAYLIRYHGYKRNDALTFLKTKRAICQPNLNFMIQLKEYEKLIHGSKEGNIEETKDAKEEGEDLLNSEVIKAGDSQSN